MLVIKWFLICNGMSAVESTCETDDVTEVKMYKSDCQDTYWNRITPVEKGLTAEQRSLSL